ncbi:MAG TPA: SURF1 family protein [Sphingomonadaceae bacterium]|nr:SURF1 family protein [Sphingomonadaceae bacterium]
MTRKLPLIPTIIVLAAVGTMVGLGVWQLQRAEWKNALLEQYAVAADAGPVEWPRTSQDVEAALYRNASIDCDRVIALDGVSGRNAEGEAGWAEIARCIFNDGSEADIVLGWSSEPSSVEWTGGEVSGVIGPGRNGEARLVAEPPLAGLEPNATPDPSDLPNNHLSYAIQWFFFALTALAIYALALRKRWKGEP